VTPLLVYFTSTFGIFQRAAAIDLVIAKDRSAQVIFLLAGYFVFLLCNILLNSCYDYFTESEIQTSVKSDIRNSLPLGFTSDLSAESPVIFYQNMFTRLSEVKSFLYRIWYKIFSALSAIMFFLYAVWSHQYMAPLIISPLIVMMALLSDRIFKKRFMSVCTDRLKANDRFVSWLKKLFESWPNIVNSRKSSILRAWIDFEVGAEFLALRRYLSISTARGTIQSLTVNGSTVCLSVFLIHQAYEGKISIGQALAWLPILGYINEASFNLLDVSNSIAEKNSRETHLKQYLAQYFGRQFQNKIVSQINGGCSWSVKVDLPGRFYFYACSLPGLYLIRGKNGCGKSTLLRSFAGYFISDEAKSSIVNATQGEGPPLSHICLLPQAIVALPVYEIDVIELKQRFSKWNIPFQLIEEWANKINEVNLRCRQEQRLSDGMNRIFLIASILIQKESTSTVLAFDEPETALDQENRKLVMQTIFAISLAHPVILTTHYAHEIELLEKEVIGESITKKNCYNSQW
jgi:energy-coupling factor transporter ATP-binding protein EcfA2